VRAGKSVLTAVLALLIVLASMPSWASEAPASGEPTEIDTTIAVKSDAATDTRIEARVRQLFSTIEGLRGVKVEVSGGVVDLSGVAATAADHDRALQLVRRIENVVDVRDAITESRDLGERMRRVLERLELQLENFIGYLPLLLVAAVIVAIAWWIANLIAGSERLMRRFARNPFLRDLARQTLRIGITVVGLLLALEVLDASTLVGSLLGAAGVLGLAIGFALRDTVENYIASLLLSLRQPFSAGDHIVIENREGRVVRLTSRATILMTLDGNHLRIPNASVYKAVIVNYTRNPKRRFQFDVGVDTEQNLAVAQDLAARTLSQMDGVLGDPPPMCTVEQLGDSDVVLRVFGWMNQSRNEFNKVRSEAIRLVKGAFDRAGIVMPEPIYNVRLGQSPAPITGAEAAPSATPRAARPAEAQAAEPAQAIDIGPRDELDEQIAAECMTGEENLLTPQAPKE
jgi:small-conductance mechanosensitive channel